MKKKIIFLIIFFILIIVALVFYKGLKLDAKYSTEDLVGHRLGEFSPTRTFHRHGGKLMKELEQRKREAEIQAAKAAKAAAASK